MNVLLTTTPETVCIRENAEVTKCSVQKLFAGNHFFFFFFFEGGVVLFFSSFESTRTTCMILGYVYHYPHPITASAQIKWNEIILFVRRITCRVWRKPFVRCHPHYCACFGCTRNSSGGSKTLCKHFNKKDWQLSQPTRLELPSVRVGKRRRPVSRRARGKQSVCLLAAINLNYLPKSHTYWSRVE